MKPQQTELEALREFAEVFIRGMELSPRAGFETELEMARAALARGQPRPFASNHCNLSTDYDD